MQSDPDPMPEPFASLAEELIDELEDLGLYTQDAVLLGGATDDYEASESEKETGLAEFSEDDGGINRLIQGMRTGEVEMGFMLRMSAGDLVWDDRTLNPEKFESEELMRAAGMSEPDQLRLYIEDQLSQGVPMNKIDLSAFKKDEE